LKIYFCWYLPPPVPVPCMCSVFLFLSHKTFVNQPKSKERKEQLQDVAKHISSVTRYFSFLTTHAFPRPQIISFSEFPGPLQKNRGKESIGLIIVLSLSIQNNSVRVRLSVLYYMYITSIATPSQ